MILYLVNVVGERGEEMLMSDFYTHKETADLLSVKPRTLEKWRFLGKGPAWHVCGRAIRYHYVDLNVWFARYAPHLTPVGPLSPAPTAKIDYMTLSRAAELAGVSPATLQAYRYNRRSPNGAPLFYRFDGETYCRRADFDAWMARRTYRVDPAAARRP